MSTGERIPERPFWNRARDLALNVLVFAGVQILSALLFWQLLFRSHPQGFAMGLTLVGFGSWALAMLAGPRGRSIRGARYGTARMDPPPELSPPAHLSAREKLMERISNVGCGTVLFLSGLVVLALAFVLRVRADMQAGMTWNDLFPTAP
jgi:hypothetical protein